MLRKFGWVLAIGVGIVSSATTVMARPASLFTPHLQQIREGLPPNTEMRLPAEILLGGPGGLDPNALIVRVIPTASPPRLTVGLFSCESGPYPCLVGSFATENATSVNAQRELNRHELGAAPITLNEGVRGYLLEGSRQTPPSEFSSLMWQQNGMIHTISFLTTERENILAMARSMATEPGLRSLQVP